VDLTGLQLPAASRFSARVICLISPCGGRIKATKITTATSTLATCSGRGVSVLPAQLYS
jgi:hypothetical protein